MAYYQFTIDQLYIISLADLIGVVFANIFWSIFLGDRYQLNPMPAAYCQSIWPC